MPRMIGKLTALKVDKAKEPGMYGDGGGLYLRVTPDRAKNWVFRFMLNGRARWMGMGPLHTVSLLEARKRASEHRLQRHDGIDPIEARRVKRLQARLDAAKTKTFKECADGYIKAHHAGWRNAKHADQWKATLATYAEPLIGKLSVQAIDTALVLRCLEPIWAAKSETAGRVRGRIRPPAASGTCVVPARLSRPHACGSCGLHPSLAFPHSWPKAKRCRAACPQLPANRDAHYRACARGRHSRASLSQDAS